MYVCPLLRVYVAGVYPLASSWPFWESAVQYPETAAPVVSIELIVRLDTPLAPVVVDVALVDVVVVVAEDELLLLVVLVLVLVVELDVVLVVVTVVVAVVVALLVVLVGLPLQATEKLVPSVERGDGCASVVPELDTIVIS